MKFLSKLFCTMLLIVSLSSTAFAFNYNNAINLAGKQRMLTQKMTKEVMLVALEIDKDANLANLKNTRDLFDKTLKGLKEGDAGLGLDKTKKPKILKQLNKVTGLWSGFDTAVSGVLSSGAVTAEQVGAVASQNIPLLKEMNKAVKFYEAGASGAGVDASLAKTINLAGKQRMLTQKMSKEYLFTAYGHEAAANKKNLGETINLFDSTLKGLMEGNDAMGLSPAPSDAIKAQLTKVQTMWGGFRSALEAGTNDAVASQNLPLLKEMNNAVQMYTKL